MPKFAYPKCPICGAVMRAQNTRSLQDGTITRQRVCPTGHRFVSAERFIRVLRGAEELLYPGADAPAVAEAAEDESAGTDSEHDTTKGRHGVSVS